MNISETLADIRQKVAAGAYPKHKRFKMEQGEGDAYWPAQFYNDVSTQTDDRYDHPKE